MFATLLSAATFLTLAVSGVDAKFSVSQPEFVQCQEAKFSWEPSKAPYNVIVVSPDNFCGDAIADIGDHDKTFMNWKVALPAGMTVQLSLQDAEGEEGWSEPITVKPSGDSSCVPPALLKQANVTTPSSPASIDPVRTTLVVPPSSAPSPASGPAPVPVGAANAGSNPSSKGNGASPLRQASAPVMIMAAAAALAVVTL